MATWPASNDGVFVAPPRRVPAVSVACAVAAGILLDRSWPLSVPQWGTAGLVLAVVGLMATGLRRRWAASAVVGLSIVAFGGARHHQARCVRPVEDVARFARGSPALVLLEGRVIAPPEVRPRSEASRVPWPEYDRTTFDVRCRSLLAGDSRIAVGGRVRVFVSGHVPHVACGDVVRVHGWFALPSPPANPGEFDYREILARDGISCIAWSGHPESVTRVEHARPFATRRLLARVRTRLVASLHDALDERSAAVAGAMLLGDRTRISRDVRDAFAESGTLHLLAISGLHVGLWAVFAWGVCRLLGFGERATAGMVIASAIGYAMLVGGRPSVVRATVFVIAWTLAWTRYRSVSPWQLLGVAATTLLVANPLQLFDTGAQLSFLAVAAIGVCERWRATGRRRPSAADLSARERWWEFVWERLRPVRSAAVVVFVIWAVTSPLVAARFHLVSPVGLLANLVLLSAVGVLMWIGFVFLIAVSIAPALAAGPAWLLNAGLRWTLMAVTASAEWQPGHLYGTGPAAWWLVGWYAFIVLITLAASRPVVRQWGGPLLLGWLVLGLAVPAGAGTGERGTLRCTFLAVGHGNAVLCEMPNGRTLLFDAGSLSDPERADQTVCRALWSRGRNRLDALIVSHADADHFNAVARIRDRVPVGRLLVARSFLDFDQPLVEAFFEEAGPVLDVRLVRRGDRLAIADDVDLSVLHPRDGVAYDSDNAESIVLAIAYAGRRILLTGDVEHDGLDALLAEPVAPVDVLASPHHGSLDANPEELFRWARPRWVVISGGNRVPLDRVAARAAPATVLSTGRDGAVTVTIDAGGRVRVEPGLARGSR